MLKTQNPSKYKLNKRLKKHLRDLGLKTAREYLTWCEENGFSVSIKKSQREVEAEYYFSVCEPKTHKDYRLPPEIIHVTI